MKTAISIITCPGARAGVDYLPRTAAALYEAGAAALDWRWVFADGDLPAVKLPGWEADFRFPRVGPRLMMWRVFARALAVGADQLIYCEDDVTPARNAIEYIRRVSVPPSVAFLDFYSNKLKPEAPSPKLYELPTLGFCGNLCVLFPRRTFEWLAAQDPLSVLLDQRYGSGIYTGSDLTMGLLLQRSPWRTYLAHLPRLVRHDGDVSAAHPLKDLRRQPFEDFDALTLLPSVVP